MSDTAENQAEYPQLSSRKPGCGFPIAKLVVWFCVTTGAVLDAAMASFNTSEWQLSRLRWEATEVNLRHLKTTLTMEMIAAKTPEMVRKDLWVHLLAYNP